MEDLSHLTGESNYKKAPIIKLNQVQLNGKTGKFVKKLMLDAKGDDGKYVKQEIETPLTVVFLKHRRRLFQYSKTERSLETNEHTHKDERVMLYGPNEKGIASELREKYPGLRTQQIVYAMLAGGEVVRVLIKGSSLGSEATAKGVMKYYDYLSSFGKDEHSYQYKTILKPVEEAGDLGSYWSISFERGEKLPDDAMERVGAKIKEVHAAVTEMDEYYKQKNADEIIKENLIAPTVEDIDIPTADEEINLDDIPF